MLLAIDFLRLTVFMVFLN